MRHGRGDLLLPTSWSTISACWTCTRTTPLNAREVIVIESRRKLGYDLGRVDGFPVLTVGESVTLRGYTITVAGDGDGAHTVTVTRDS